MSEINNIMVTLNTSDQEQTGGWRSLQIAPIEEILVCPDILTNQNANLVSLNAGPTTIDILPVSESINISVLRKRDKAGFQYTIKIVLDFFYQSIALDNFLNDYLNKKVVVIGVTSYGSEKMFGSKLHPLTFNYDLIDGKNIEDPATTQVTISAVISQKPVIIKD